MTRLWNYYVRAIESAAIAGAIALVLVAVMQVFFRYVIGQSLFWSEELMRYLLIWLVFLCSGLAFTRGQFLGMTALLDALPSPARKVLKVLNAIAMLIFLGVIIKVGWEFAERTSARLTPALRISMFWVNASVAVGSFILALHILAHAVRDVFESNDDHSEERS